MPEEDWKNEIALKMVMDKIGIDFELLDYIGGGGLAKIYTVRHTLLDEVQALKIMDFNYIFQVFEKANVEDINQEFEKIKNRFINEAKIYRRLSHPNIIKIHKIGFVKYEPKNIDIPYLVMEFVKGKSLKKILKEKSPPDMQTVLKISENVLSALDAIHRSGVIHRDIKPSNIMIKDENGEVVLIDFGLAKDIENGEGLTVSRTAMGTLNYMSPEMFRDSKEISPGTDIYSFGVVLYEMIVGEVPFSGSFPEIMHGHLNIITSIPEEFALKNPGLAKGVDRILKKAMAKSVKDRYQSADAFVNDLKELEIELLEIEKGARLKKRKVNRIISLFGIIVLAAFFIIDPFGIIKEGNNNNNSDIQYREHIAFTKRFIQSNELEKAIASLSKAKRIKDTDEAKQLEERIIIKQKENMSKDFDGLKEFLKGDASSEEKLLKCREFLSKHQSVPQKNDITSMVSEINKIYGHLKAEIAADEQYQTYIDFVNKFIESGDYEKAIDSLNNAKGIKDTIEVKELLRIIEKKQKEKIEFERKNGRKDYDEIKGKINRNRYLAFKKKFPNSIYLQDLRNSLRVVDKTLPPEKYWGKAIKKNSKGYYQLEFGSKYNRHLMIYIPEKNIWIDKYEVSWLQFRSFLDAERIQSPARESGKYIKHGDEFPAVVTYENAERYSKRYGFRLPKEDEWEYAAGKGKFTYPWGDELPDENGIYRANFDSLDGMIERDGYSGTAPVKTFERFSSPYGVVNMAGNVWEWVQGKILKGGGFFSEKEDLLIQKRNVGKSGIKDGFRCIKDENRNSED